jgi:hypothetical protein
MNRFINNKSLGILEPIKMQKGVINKGLVFGIIAIFCCLALTPTIGHLHITSPDKQEIACAFDEGEDCEVPLQEFEEIEVTEYKPDGSINTKRMILRQREIKTLEERLSIADTLEEKLSLLKEYGLIPAEASPEVMEAGMRHIAENMGITEEKTQNFASNYRKSDMWFPPISISFFNEVSTTFRRGTSVRIGLTPYLRLIDRLIGLNIPRGIDIIDICWGMKGTVFTKGSLGEHTLYLEPGFLVLVGFIGYSYKRPFFRHSFTGASVMTFTIGFGSHDFDPWFP